MARKTRYYYDEESCSFLEEKLTPSQIFKRSLSTIFLGLILASVMVSTYFFAYDDPKQAMLIRKIKTLETNIAEFDKNNKELTSKVDQLHQQDNNLYRSILGMKEIPDWMFNGGKGGAANQEMISSPESVKKAEKTLDLLSNKIKIQEESYKLLMKELSNNKEKLAHIPAIKPVPGRLISGFGMRMHPILKIRKMHTGIDLEARIGTPVYATGDAVVKFAGLKSNGYGIHVDLDHGYGYVTKYGHLSKIAVKRGQKVKRGDVIGYTGSTGQSKGPHLHYEVEREEQKINPVNYFYQDYTPEEFLILKKEAQIENESMD